MKAAIGFCSIIVATGLTQVGLSSESSEQFTIQCEGESWPKESARKFTKLFTVEISGSTGRLFDWDSMKYVELTVVSSEKLQHVSVGVLRHELLFDRETGTFVSVLGIPSESSPGKFDEFLDRLFGKCEEVAFRAPPPIRRKF